MTEQSPVTWDNDKSIIKPPSSGPSKFNVANYIVDFNEKLVITPSGEQRNITPNLYKLLELLLSNSESYFSSEDIHNAVYGQQYKDESSLRKLIASARKLFDDNGRDMAFIETKTGYGYRMAAVVSVVSSDERATNQLKPGRTQTNRNLWLSLIIISTMLLFMIYLQWFRDNTLTVLNQKTTRLTHLEGIELYPSLSADGRWLLFNYTSAEKDQWQIYVRDMLNGDLIPLSEPVNYDRMPRWSGEADQIIFSRISAGGRCMFMTGYFNAETLAIDNVKDLVPCSESSETAQGEFWPDGTGMYYNKATSANAPFIIYAHSFSSDDSWSIASPPPTGKGDYYFKLSNDGSQLAVLRNKNWTQTELWIYNTETWETSKVDTIDGILNSVDWSLEDRSIFYRDEANQIIEYNLQQERRVVAFRPNEPFLTPSQLPNGHFIVSYGSYFKTGLLKLSLADQTSQRVVSSSYRDRLPAISGDGKQLAWISNRTGVFQIWYKGAKGVPRQLTTLKNNLKFSALSFNADNSKLGGTAGGRWFVYDLSAKTIEWSKGENYYTNFQWRKQSNLAYVATKHMEDWVQIELNTDTKITREVELPADVFIALESTHSDYVFLASFDKSGFWRLNTKTNEMVFFVTPEPINSSMRWIDNKQGLYFTIEQQLYRLAHDADQISPTGINVSGNYFTMTADAESVISQVPLKGELDLVEFE
ncbi:MAG: winged helix-turn-helix domain-containing protein [Kangiellaceae bacterium]|jgi:Tol biopolymer transport system component/DNA-binding winged helix-turn-helix (wHTH) protein|nr:winged helix-turn-helix domain-containing protein [Kangiellaceae bacterium]